MAARALAAGCVDIWLTDPDAIDDPARLRAYEGLLGKDEYLRYRRYLAPKRRHDFLVSRALLRTSLSRYADVAPAAWRFDVNRFGKPLVRGTETNLRFSLSHADGLIACAVTRGGDIGVDVEPLNRSVNMRAIARATFAPPELERLECLTGTEQARFFFSIWTLKEAYVKAHGRGLTLALREFWFEIGGESIAIRFAPGWDDLPGRWNFWQTVTRSGHVLSLALAGSATADDRVRLEEAVPDG